MIDVDNLAPIVLFVYNRQYHAENTIEALKKNYLADKSELVIFSDGPPDEKSSSAVNDVRRYIKSVKGFKHVTIIERSYNYGLANSILDGVTSVVNQYGKIIVLEDDLITSPNFLTYMNDALEMYKNDERIISIHGYVYPVYQELPETFFLTGADCWGWATWSRGWKYFNSDGQYLLDQLTKKNLLKSFDYNDSYPYSKMLKAQIKGANDSWAIRWHASAFLANKLTLYPGRSLVENIGNDNSGTHCGYSNRFDAHLTETQINLNDINVESSTIAKQAFEEFFRKSNKSLFVRLFNKLQKVIKPSI